MNKVTKGQWNGYDTYILHSPELEVTLLPRLGNNIIRLWDCKHQRDVLRHPDENELEFYLQKPYHFGIPLLFPPGRINKGQFQYEGQQYSFDRNTANDNHIHGLHRIQSWCVSDIEEEEDSCAIITEFNTQNDENWMRQFPAPLKLEMTLRLQGSVLTQSFKITHLGDKAVPIGLGLHTWFLLDGEPERWQIKLPCEGIYELNEEQIPTGNIEPLGNLSLLKEGLNLANQNFDTLFHIGNHPAEALLLREDGYGIKYTADEAFKHWVLFTKGDIDQFLCIEPYTWLPNAPNLPVSPQISGLIGLQPQQTISVSTKLEILSALE
ncbi:aldose 1-epimerase [Paenibacillus turicensis]|uniref:Aldose 1-epimerase n=1 Tax=Paenibacillus turicensis TaxID=160487 RepID=A0ABS4FSN0_9BACL|nr:aldose 1-epimerase [Paenibacillus turicensis]MBP1905585.1 aldose 1-epimerase [Paenibacillus turicensis]